MLKEKATSIRLVRSNVNGFTVGLTNGSISPRCAAFLEAKGGKWANRPIFLWEKTAEGRRSTKYTNCFYWKNLAEKALAPIEKGFVKEAFADEVSDFGLGVSGKQQAVSADAPPAPSPAASDTKKTSKRGRVGVNALTHQVDRQTAPAPLGQVPDNYANIVGEPAAPAVPAKRSPGRPSNESRFQAIEGSVSALRSENAQIIALLQALASK
jgi:hypothetical protein